ncbi:MAG: hypothetical protein ACRDTN_02555 [Mycobacterium sp.]
MATTNVPNTPQHGSTNTWEQARHDPAYAAFWLLRIGFVILPLWMGIDKFTKTLQPDWPGAIAPWIADIAQDLGLTTQTVMYIIGVIEIVAAILVAIKPRYAGYVVAAWLACIIINLVTYTWGAAAGTVAPGYDIALRDFGLLVAAVALAWLGAVYDRGGSSTHAGQPQA